MTPKVIDQHITISPHVVGGKPRIAGHRITVQDIAIWHEYMGKSADEIAAEYDVTLADVYAALVYYFDHKAQINASIEEGKSFIETLERTIQSKVKQKLQR